RFAADDRLVADRHGDVVVGVERGVGRPIALIDGMVAARLQRMDRLQLDQAFEIGHGCVPTERRTGSAPGLTYCLISKPPSMRRALKGSDCLTKSDAICAACALASS